MEVEQRVFATDRLSRRSMWYLLRSRSAQVIVAAAGGAVVGAAVVLYRRRSAVARLYSIAVEPRHARCGVGARLLETAEAAARWRDCSAIRLEVHESNAAAIARYRKSGYSEFGRHRRYYEDGGDALRFEKRLARPAGRRSKGRSKRPFRRRSR